MKRLLVISTILYGVIALANAKTIDFDTTYGAASGSALITKIGTAISSADAGDTILFKSAQYDFADNKLTISKAVTLSGIIPTQSYSSEPGAYDVQTQFINVMNLYFGASNIGFINLEVVANDSDSYVFNRIKQPTNTDVTNFQFYTGLIFHNVIFRDGQVQIYTGEGAGAHVSNVSFLNFSKSGWLKNRKEKIDYCPQVIFKRCHFVANEEKAYYDTRGIATDAGNDEYPIVWNHSNMLIDSCIFDRAGVGFSKGENATITNNHFIGYSKYIDMIHMEEYTNNIWIENNLFEYAAPSRTFFVDREGQPCSDITIINNTFKGQYYWIFWSNSPINLRFEGNDLTQASASDASNLTFDFTDFHDEAEHIPYDMPMEGFILRNNTGIDKESIGIMSICTLSGDDSNTIEDYPTSKIQNKTVSERPSSLLETDYRYQIRNKATQEVFVAQPSDSKIALTTTIPSDKSDLWEVAFRYPYTYEFKNVKTGQYLEVDYAYTLGDYSKDPEDLDTHYLEQKSKYVGKDKVPHFFIRRYWVSREEYWEIAPGGNEQKSRVIKSGADAILEMAIDKDNGGFFDPDDASKWEFIQVEKNPNGLESVSSNTIKVYPNPAKDILYIETEHQDRAFTCSIYSVSGQLKKKGSILNTSIDVSELSKGMYIIQINEFNYQQLFIKK